MVEADNEAEHVQAKMGRKTLFEKIGGDEGSREVRKVLEARENQNGREL